MRSHVLRAQVDADKIYTAGKDGFLRTWTAVVKPDGGIEMQPDLSIEIGCEARGERPKFEPA